MAEASDEVTGSGAAAGDDRQTSKLQMRAGPGIQEVHDGGDYFVVVFTIGGAQPLPPDLPISASNDGSSRIASKSGS
jgi:hypothetical protein